MRAHISDVVGALVLEGLTYSQISRVLSRLPAVDDSDTLPPETLETCPPPDIYTQTDCEALALTMLSAS